MKGVITVAFRTDLALEQHEGLSGDCRGVNCDVIDIGDTKITRIEITDDEGAKKIGRPIGKYITIEMPSFDRQSIEDESRLSALTTELKRLIPSEGLILIAGLGNSRITPDALGPKTVGGILATRHIAGELARAVGLEGLRPAAAVSPGVLGQTGIETAEILSGIVGRVKPAAVIAVDALASRKLSRLGRTVQLCNTGISPGSGVNNSRSEISSKTLGVPVISMGVPTVVDAGTLANDLVGSDNGSVSEIENADMMVTPREIDAVIDHAAALISMAINRTLHEGLSVEEIHELTGNG